VIYLKVFNPLKNKKRIRLCRVTAASFYVNTSLRMERNKFGVINTLCMCMPSIMSHMSCVE
jgi:hypothetical protein